jgi:hypothetical protein
MKLRIAIVGMMLAGGGVWPVGGETPARLARTLILPPTVAAPTGGLQDWAHKLQAGLLTGLSRDPAIGLVERESLDLALKELELSATSLSAEKALALGQLTGAEYLLSCHCAAEGDAVRLYLRILNTWLGQIEFAQSMAAPKTEKEKLAAWAVKTAGEELTTLAARKSPVKTFVAVPPFVNRSVFERYDYLEETFAKALREFAGKLPAVQIVERSRIEELLKESEFQASGGVEPGAARDPRQPAHLVLAEGSFEEVAEAGKILGKGATLRLTLACKDLSPAGCCGNIAAMGNADEIPALLADVQAKFLAFLLSRNTSHVASAVAEAKRHFHRGVAFVMASDVYEKRAVHTWQTFLATADSSAGDIRPQQMGPAPDAVSVRPAGDRSDPRELENVANALQEFSLALFLDPSFLSARGNASRELSKISVTL